MLGDNISVENISRPPPQKENFSRRNIFLILGVVFLIVVGILIIFYIKRNDQIKTAGDLKENKVEVGNNINITPTSNPLLNQENNGVKERIIIGFLFGFLPEADAYYYEYGYEFGNNENANRLNYGEPFAPGRCPETGSTIDNVFTKKTGWPKALDLITEYSKINRCASSDQSYAVVIELPTPETYACVDSSIRTGNSPVDAETIVKKITGKKLKDTIIGKGTKDSPYKCAE